MIDTKPVHVQTNINIYFAAHISTTRMHEKSNLNSKDRYATVMCVYRPDIMIIERILCLESEHHNVEMDSMHTHSSEEMYKKTLEHKCKELEQMNKMLIMEIKMMEDETPNTEDMRSIFQEKEHLLVIWQDYMVELKMQQESWKNQLCQALMKDDEHAHIMEAYTLDSAQEETYLQDIIKRRYLN